MDRLKHLHMKPGPKYNVQGAQQLSQEIERVAAIIGALRDGNRAMEQEQFDEARAHFGKVLIFTFFRIKR
jgi:hypothetical protein